MGEWDAFCEQTDTFYREDPRDGDNNLTFAWFEDGSVEVGVSQEKAVDSYNSTFTCFYTLKPDQVTELIAWLQKPPPPMPHP